MDDKGKPDVESVKKALFTTFATDSFRAYEQFVAQRLRSDETVDVYLAELRKLGV